MSTSLSSPVHVPHKKTPCAVSWPRVKLGDVCRIGAPVVDPRSSAYRDLPHVNGERIESGSGRLLPLRSAADDGMTSQKYLFDAGDVLYSKLRPYLRKVARANFRGLCSADMYPLKAAPDILDPDYLVITLLSEKFTAFAVNVSSRSRMPKLNRKQLLGWRLTLPPLDEQRRIAGQLAKQFEVAQAARAAALAQLEAARALPAACLRSLLAAGEMHNWPRVPLGNKLHNIQAGTSIDCPGRQARSDEWGVLKVSALSLGEFRPEENKAIPQGYVPDPADEVHDGDLLISRANTRELVGATVVVHKSRDQLLLSDKTLRLCVDEKSADKRFLMYALQEPSARTFLEENATGTSPSMRNLSQEKIRRTPIIAPPLHEQIQIRERLDQMMAASRTTIRVAEAQLAEIDTLPAVILRQAFTGML
ncbi:MAG: restriction endonuclease subunit S [Chloroflexi bacterium]|nr:restriction endonuclease subunit S [Chloroflexota bacterium]